MAQHFLTPVVILARGAYSRRLSVEIGRGAHPAAAHTASERQVTEALYGLDISDDEIASILRAVYEMDRADRRSVRLSANRALTVAFTSVREDDLAERSTVGCEPSTIYRRNEDGEVFEQVIARSYSARTQIMRRACPHGVYQSGWSRAQVLLAARRAGRVLP